MFFKPKNEPQTPHLEGEDFDIFPDLGDAHRFRPATTDANAAQAKESEVDDPPEPTALQKKIADIPDDKWKLYQTLAGAVLGLVVGCALFLRIPGNETSSLGMLIGAIIALFAPKYLELQAARKIPRLRTAMLVTSLVVLALYLCYGLLINPDYMR